MFQDVKQKLVDSFEKQYIERALQITNGNVAAAARMSGKNRRALIELMRKHGIDPEQYRIVKPNSRTAKVPGAAPSDSSGLDMSAN